MPSNYRLFFGALAVGSLTACAHAVPSELVDARAAYARASRGPAVQRAPADLHKAKGALSQAESAYDDQPGEQRTRDLSYVALRKIELAEVIAKRSADD